MELFVIKNNSGEVVRADISSKKEAKKFRKELHAEAGVKESEIENWNTKALFHVSKGSKHRKTAPKNHR